MKNKKKYLITGAAGFVGSCIARRLIEKGDEVHILLRNQSQTWRIEDLKNKINVHECDLLDLTKLKSLVKTINPNIIYHLAAYGAYSFQDEADKIIKTNINSTWNLLQACSQIDYDLFVNTGSSSEYGFKNKPMRESDLLEPASYYAVSKCTQTLLCSYIAKADKRPIVTLRLFSVYGSYEDPTRLIPTLMKSLFNNREMSIVSPKIARDFIHINDVVDVYLMVDRLKKFPGMYFNVGTGIQSSLRQTAMTAVKVTGKKIKFNWGAMEKRIWDSENWVADVSQAWKILNWKSRINLEEGLLLTWRWFQDHYKFYQ